MFHVDRRLPPIALSEFILIAAFTSARIGADPVAARADNVETLTQLCKMAGVCVEDVAAEAARKQLDKCMHMPESFLNDAIRPLMPSDKKRFIIPYVMDTTQVAALQLAFPELNVCVNGKVSHSHPYAAAATLASEELILRKLNYDESAAVEAGYTAAIVDVGANYPRHAKNGRLSIHCCVPIIDVRDSARETTRIEVLRQLTRRSKLSAATANAYLTRARPTRVRCFSRAQNCDVRAPAMMFVHSQYDVPMTDLQDMFDAHQPRVAISVLNFIPAIFYETAGKCDVLGVEFRRDVDNDRVSFDFMNDSSMGYSHTLSNLKEIYATQVVVTKKGRTYLVERFVRGSALFLQYTYCEVKPETMSFAASFSFWNSACDSTVVLATWEYDAARFASSKFRTQANPVMNFKRKYVTVDRRFYDLLYSHCIRSGDKSFNFNEVFSAALTFNSKMCINGNDIRAVNRVSSVDLVHAVVAIYSIAYRDRFEAGKSIEAYTTAEKLKRGDRHVGVTNFFGAAFKAMANRGFFDSIKESWNHLLDAMAKVYGVSELDATMFQSVRAVRFSEFITIHGRFDDSPTEIDSVDVKEVNVRVSPNGLLQEVVGIIRNKVAQDTVTKNVDDPRVEGDLPPAPATAPIDPWNIVTPIVTNKNLRYAKTEFHRRNSKKTPANSSRLTVSRKEGAVCTADLELIPMPPDGHCVYHSLGAFVGLRQDEMRHLLYYASEEKDETMLLMDGSFAGWGTTDAVTTFSVLYNCRVCVHVIQDGIQYNTLCYTHNDVPASAPVRHIRWATVGSSGHVDVLCARGESPLLPDLLASRLKEQRRQESADAVGPCPAKVEAAAQPASTIDPLELSVDFEWDDLSDVQLFPPHDVEEPKPPASVSQEEPKPTATASQEELVLPPPVPDRHQLAYVEQDDFIARYGLDPVFKAVPFGASEFMWFDLASFATSIGGDDRFENLMQLSVYPLALHYDLDGVFSLFPGKKIAFFSNSCDLPSSLAEVAPKMVVGEEYDVIVSTEFFVPQDALRPRDAFIVRVENFTASPPEIPGFTKTMFRGKFSALTDMSAFFLYCAAGKKVRVSNWHMEMVRSLNHTINNRPAYTLEELRLMVKPLAAGGVIDALDSIVDCAEHIEPAPDCARCIFLNTETSPLVVQSLWFNARTAVLKKARAITEGGTEPFFPPKRLSRAIIHYLQYEKKRTQKTGFTADGVCSYSDVDRHTLLRAYDRATNSYAQRAIDISAPGVHKVECGAVDSGKVVHAETYGVVSKLTVSFSGAKTSSSVLENNTRFAPQHVDIRRTHVNAVISDVGSKVRDVAVSTTSEVEVVVFGERNRVTPNFTRAVKMVHSGTQTQGFAGVTRAEVRAANEFTSEPEQSSESATQLIPGKPQTTAPTQPPPDPTVSLAESVSAATLSTGVSASVASKRPASASESASVLTSAQESVASSVSATTVDSVAPLLVSKEPSGPAKSAKPDGKKSLAKKVNSAVQRFRQRVALGSSDTSSTSEFEAFKRNNEGYDQVLTSAQIRAMLPIDAVSDVLAVEDRWLNFPWHTKIHLTCVDASGTAFPESFVKRFRCRKLSCLPAAGFRRLTDTLHCNAAMLEFVLIFDGRANESVFRSFLRGLPENCARVSVEIDALLSESAICDALLETKQRVCLVAQKHRSWSAVLARVNPDVPRIAPISVPLAFPRVSSQELGYQRNPTWIQTKTRDDAYKNSMIEFLHITKHADEFNKQTFRRMQLDAKNGPVDGQLESLRSEGIYVFDNRPDRLRFLGTDPHRKYSHAYSPSTDAYVQWDEKAKRFVTNDKFVLTSRFTETMLSQQIYSNLRDVPIMKQNRPILDWINGPPGCGKTYTILQTAKISPSRLSGQDLILSMTKEGREAIIKALLISYPELGPDVIGTHVRTVASVLVNGSKISYDRVLMDEALMAHAGTIGYVAALTDASTILIIGDVNQIPFVDRDHMCELRYYSPACFADISSVLEITYRCPIDVTYALHELYPGLCTKSTVSVSMLRKPYSSEKAAIRKDLVDCLYLVHFQADKDNLIREGYGVGRGSKVLTIHEAQGLTFKHVVCVRTNSKALALYDKTEYAVVAISRHTLSFVYYSDQSDAITKLIARAKLSDSELCTWNAPRLVAAQAKLSPKRKAGGVLEETGLLYTEEQYLTRDFAETDENLTYGLPHDTHMPLRPHVPHRVTRCLTRVPTWKGAAEKDVAYLQAFYDSLMPGVASRDYAWDQIMMEGEDTYLRCTNISVYPHKGIYKAPTYGTLRPRLRTIMQKRKVRSQKESLLGAIKRNLNAPELANPSLCPEEIGRALFVNFERSGIDPLKRHIYQAYRDDPVDISSPVIATWLEKQPPGRRAQIVSDLPLHLRPYNDFRYMVKTEVKPQLTPAASDVYPSVQTIIYNEPSVNAIFCPIFNVLFDRLISVLHPKILLLSGLSKVDFEKEINTRITPELVASVRAVENDFSKYDKAQAAALRKVEQLLWDALGLPRDLADIWDRSRKKSIVRDRDGGIRFETEYQRKSGEATTFSGNTFVAICVVLGIFDIDDILLVLAAGDDTLIFLKDGTVVSDSARLIADLFNLECKLLDRYRIPYFCSAFIIPTQFWIYVVPDPFKFVTKLGRHDMKNYAHVEEYRVSCLDTMQSLFNSEVSQGLSLAVLERYGGYFGDMSKLQSVIRTLCHDPDLFASLFLHDRGVKLFEPPQKVKEKHVTAELL
uniref:Replicase large subunit n=1 Tax=Atrato Virga-like virus 1 TaxID=2689340 RepID=A0A6B9KG99_9VIRU|nr:polyprotein [Atrato Virga-like virus 1]